MSKIHLAFNAIISVFNDIKNDSSIIKKLIAVFISFMLLPVAVMAFLFPYTFDPNKNDPYIEAARTINAEVHSIDDIKIIDLIVFLDGDHEKISKVDQNQLISRYKKYYYNKKPKDSDSEYAYIAKHFNDIISDLKAQGLIDKETEQNLLDAIDLASNSDPTSLDGSSVAITKGDFVLPFNKYEVTAGTWNYPVSFGGGWHPGIDLAVPIGTKVKAPINLTKIFQHNTDNGGYGIWSVYVGQVKDDAYVMIFGHLSQINGSQSYKQNDVIAYSGNTGSSSGPHTHIEIFYFKNQTANEVIKQYRKHKDYWFGLGYSSKGNCNKVCRLRPENVFKVKVGERR
ncbi:M23 family metallopeptidase [Erysipelotrichaceae bacterium OttesenSCG-928-M19]|nr:M23 family metallopeptidase [Erysipelotrichaceae bacterium OttesenSCG-928-M19]